MQVGCYQTGGGVGPLSLGATYLIRRTRRQPVLGVAARMSIHLINPRDIFFGTAVITPRWLFVLAAATPRSMGDPIIGR
jgi:hypothetical protein